MSADRWDKMTAHLPDSRRDIGNGYFIEETTRICPVCADVDCIEHDDHPEMSDAEVALRNAQFAAVVVAAARTVMQAWDVSEGTDRRLALALSELSDALAKFDRLPF